MLRVRSQGTQGIGHFSHTKLKLCIFLPGTEFSPDFASLDVLLASPIWPSLEQQQHNSLICHQALPECE